MRRKYTFVAQSHSMMWLYAGGRTAHLTPEFQ